MEENDNKAGLRRIYRKSWPYDNLFGSSRFELTPADRGIWNDLIDLAKISRVRPGLIAAGTDSPYTHAWLGGLLNVTSDEFEHAHKVLTETKRIHENGAGIEILNWKKYQSEYDRQKPYRQKKAVSIDDSDPDRFVKGKYGHMVIRTAADGELTKQEKKERLNGNNQTA